MSALAKACADQFAPCEPCGGDPGAEDRARRVAETGAYWRDREKASQP